VSTGQPEKPSHLSASLMPSELKFSKLAQVHPGAQPIDLEQAPVFFEEFPVLNLIA
jgi:hypothetical protein